MSAALAHPPFEQHDVAVVLHMPVIRHCASCRLPIPAKRLLAQPEAKLCIGCMTATGDVPVIRRFDELTPQGETVGTYFMNDQYVEQQLCRGVRRVEKAVDETATDRSRRTLMGVTLSRAVFEQGVSEFRELSESRRKK